MLDSKIITDLFSCRFTLNIIEDPVLTPCGHTYDRLYLIQTLEHQGMCPSDRKPVKIEQLISNIFFKNALIDFRKILDESGQKDILNISNLYKCPITGRLLRHPVSLPCGHTFEEGVLREKCFEIKCPIDRQVFLSNQIYKNFAAENIMTYVSQFGNQAQEEQCLGMLSIEIKNLIFSYLGKDLIKMSRINKEFNSIFQDPIFLSHFIERFTNGFGLFERLASCFQFSVRKLIQIPEDCRLLVKHLNLSGQEIPDLSHLIKAYPNLQSLNLSYCKISDKELESLIKLKNLQTLDLSGCENITEAVFLTLTELKKLRILNLAFCIEITDKELIWLSELKNLESLNLRSYRNITTKGFQILSEFKNLQKIQLSDHNVTDEELKLFVKLKKLKTLRLWKCIITDEGLKSISELKNLRKLSLRQLDCIFTEAGVHFFREKVTDKGLTWLSELQNLQELNLVDFSNITDKGLESIIKLKTLRKLSLYSCIKISNEGLRLLTELGNLQELDLIGMQISDKGITALIELKRLQSLNLSCCKITYEGLRLLNKLKNLHKLSLVQCREICRTIYLKKKLKKLMPWTRINIDY